MPPRKPPATPAASSSGTGALLARLAGDARFRKRFARDPGRVLAELGFEPDLLDLPDHIDAAALEQAIAAGLSADAPGMADVLAKTPQQLWDDHRFIRANHGRIASELTSLVTVTGPVTALIYGTTAVVTVATSGRGPPGMAARMEDFARLSALRRLMRQPAADISFEIADAKGAVTRLPLDQLRRLMGW